MPLSGKPPQVADLIPFEAEQTVRPSGNATEAPHMLRAKAGDRAAFDQLVAPYRRLVHTHCYRMLGSPFDADDAVQETLLAAWRGLKAFEERSALGTWLYRIATRVCLRLISKRPRRMTSADYGAPLQSCASLGEPVLGPVWLEPIPDAELLQERSTEDDPAATFARREHIGLAFVAMLQHLPGTQRAVFLLREVLDFSAAETAAMLGITMASANSALQRSRKTVTARLPSTDRARDMLRPDDGLDRLLRDFVIAWESRDITAMVQLLSVDVRFTMPPLPAWFEGRRSVEAFFAERVFATPWQLRPLHGNGHPGFACYLKPPGDDRFRPGGVVLLRVSGGRIAALDSFQDPEVMRRFGMLNDV